MLKLIAGLVVTVLALGGVGAGLTWTATEDCCGTAKTDVGTTNCCTSSDCCGAQKVIKTEGCCDGCADCCAGCDGCCADCCDNGDDCCADGCCCCCWFCDGSCCGMTK